MKLKPSAPWFHSDPVEVLSSRCTSCDFYISGWCHKWSDKEAASTCENYQDADTTKLVPKKCTTCDYNEDGACHHPRLGTPWSRYVETYELTPPWCPILMVPKK